MCSPQSLAFDSSSACLQVNYVNRRPGSEPPFDLLSAWLLANCRLLSGAYVDDRVANRAVRDKIKQIWKERQAKAPPHASTKLLVPTRTKKHKVYDKFLATDVRTLLTLAAGV